MRDLLERQAHAEVSTRDHHAIGGLDDLVDLLDGRLGLDLGDQHRPIRAGGPPDRADVVRMTHEGDSDPVNAGLAHRLEKEHVLGGRGGRAEPSGRKVHTGAPLEASAAAHDRHRLVVADFDHGQLNAAVSQCHQVAGAQVGEEIGVVDNGALGRAGLVSGAARRQVHRCTLHEEDSALRVRAGADLGAGQVRDDADLAAGRGRGRANPVQPRPRSPRPGRAPARGGPRPSRPRSALGESRGRPMPARWSRRSWCAGDAHPCQARSRG